MEQHARVGGQRPVVVLARPVDTIKRLLVQQHAEAVPVGHFLHQTHEQHVVVDGQIALLVDRGQFKLVGGHLVVARLTRDAQFEGMYFEIFHERLHALGNGAKVVVVHLLVLG